MITEKEMLEALKGMASQYLTDIDGEITHGFTRAGEKCLNILERRGIVKTDSGIYYKWAD